VVATLADMVAAWGNRDAFLCREATKRHEEYVREPLSAIHARLAERDEVKGEIVLVVEGAAEPTAAEGDAETLFAALAAEGRTRRDAVKETARRLGLPARDVYRRVLKTEKDEE
jgi:16S rRNA (cytidine1402-2'-O)-methyltransferase